VSHSQDVSNGLLLRSDIHTLFDLDLIGVNPATFEIALAPRLLKTSYVELVGTRIQLPDMPARRPNSTAMSRRWAQFKNREEAAI
jgi:hypothetical protein